MAWQVAPLAVLLLGLLACRSVPTYVWWTEYAPLGGATLAALWLLQSNRRESGRAELTEGGLLWLLAIVVMCALTGAVQSDHSFGVEYAQYYTCFGPHAAAHQTTHCDVMVYGFAWSPWPALALMLAAAALFTRRKTASLFVAAAAALTLWVPSGHWDSLLGDHFVSFPGPGVMSCMRWPHAGVHFQPEMRVALAVVWLPWIGGMLRFLVCGGGTPDWARAEDRQ